MEPKDSSYSQYLYELHNRGMNDLFKDIEAKSIEQSFNGIISEIALEEETIQARNITINDEGIGGRYDVVSYKPPKEVSIDDLYSI